MGVTVGSSNFLKCRLHYPLSYINYYHLSCVLDHGTLLVHLCLLSIAHEAIFMTLLYNDTFKLGTPIGHYLFDWLLVNLNWRRAVSFGLISTIVSINPSDGATQTCRLKCHFVMMAMHK